MADPLILSTWSFGRRANAAAWPALAAGGAALDAVEAACRDAEDDPDNHTVGLSGFPDREGVVSLDASIMLAPGRCGSVSAVRRLAHPISIARRVMEKTRHIMLAGEGAERFAEAEGFARVDPPDGEARRAWQRWRQTSTTQTIKANVEEGGHDTIGVLAIDSGGTLAGACSTSGMPYKLPGRVGDSPIIGHALYVEPGIGAAVTTGHGELVMGVCGSFLAVETLRRGAKTFDAAREVLSRIAGAFELSEEDQVGIIVVSANGSWTGAALRPGFRVAVRTPQADELLDPEYVIHP